MIQIFGDLIADISMRLPSFPVEAKDIHRLSYLEVGPGGACNVAIMAARFGLPVGCLGEVGDDGFGLVVREGLKREGIDVEGLKVTVGAKTPVAGVVVDRTGEPAYLGHPGSLEVNEFQSEWLRPIQEAEALYADGWAEHRYVPAIILRAFEAAQKARVPVFFDPGPGNPDVDDAWVRDALTLSTVVLLNRGEAARLTGMNDDEAAIATLMNLGAEMVLLKRGAQGLIIARADERQEIPGLDVEIRDATGAGDSLAGAVLYASKQGMDLEAMARLANATGAAKVQKLGTGHNMPSLAEIGAMLETAGLTPGEYITQN